MFIQSRLRERAGPRARPRYKMHLASCQFVVWPIKAIERARDHASPRPPERERERAGERERETERDRDLEELDAARWERLDGVEDIVGAERYVLHARLVVIVHELLDLYSQ